jgi:hypothetical protein
MFTFFLRRVLISLLYSPSFYQRRKEKGSLLRRELKKWKRKSVRLRLKEAVEDSSKMATLQYLIA